MRSKIVSAATLAVIAVLLLPSVTVAEDYADVVHVYADNEEGFREIARVKITKDDLDGVTWENQAKRPESKPAGEIRGVFYGDAPPEWDKGLGEMSTRQYDRAIQSFVGAVNAHEAKHCGPWVVEYAAFQTARCLAAKARAQPKVHLPAAITALKKFLADYENSRHRPDALLAYAEVLMLAEQGGEARRQYEAVEKLAADKSLFVRYSFEALLGKAATYALESDWSHAIPDYESIEKRAANETRFAKGGEAKAVLEEIRLVAAGRRGDALLSKAERSGRDGDYAEAKNYFQGLTGRLGTSDRVRAMSGVGEAVCLLSENKARLAIRKLAEVKVAFFAQRTEVAKALYYMAKAADKLGHSAQAVIYLKELKELYSDTEWARRAD